jgi:tetratricopeptide (TPR) repeat protein
MAGACEALWIRLGRDPRLETTLLDTKAWIAVADGDDRGRLAFRERRAELTAKLYGENSREYAFAIIKVAAAKWELGMVHESNELEARALKLMTELRGADDVSLIYRAVSLGGGLAEEGRRDEAIAMLDSALTRARKELEASDSTTAEILIALADTLEHFDDVRALQLANEGVAWFEASKDASSLAWALRTRARSLALNGKPKEALADCKRARSLDAQFHDPQKKNVRASFICEAEALEKVDPAGAFTAWKSADELVPASLLPGTRGRVAFGLARTMRATKKDPAKVREVAQRARADYALLPSFTERLAAIDAFLAQ